MMKSASMALIVAAGLMSTPTLAQSSSDLDSRIGKVEKELKAVQRKVFPGGANTYFEPEISTARPDTSVVPGSPSTAPLTSLLLRVNAIETQLASLTGRTDENAYKLKQLEDAFAKYKVDMDAKLATALTRPSDQDAPEAASPFTPPPQGAAPKPSTSKPTPSADAGKPVPAKPIPAASPAQTEARKLAVAAVQRPDTGDAPSDAYSYGYRLWEKKFYPEAQVQLQATLDKYGSNPIASRTQNLLGRAFLDDNQPSKAARQLYENYRKRRDGDRAADSLAWLGEALIQIKQLTEACTAYQELDEVYGTTMSATLKDMMVKGRARAKCGA